MQNDKDENLNKEEIEMLLTKYKKLIHEVKEVESEKIKNDKNEGKKSNNLNNSTSTINSNNLNKVNNLLLSSQSNAKNTLYKCLEDSEYYKNRLILLSDKQEYDENISYQSLLDLFIEENQSILELSLNSDNVNEYLKLQLYNAFSQKARKIFLDDSNSPDINKQRVFFQSLNNIKYDPKAPLNNKILTFINNNIINIQELNQSKNNNDIIEQNDVEVIEAEEDKSSPSKVEFIIDNGDEKFMENENFSIDKNINNGNDGSEYKNKKLNNLEYIINIDENDYKSLSKEEYARMLENKYYETNQIFQFDEDDSSKFNSNNDFQNENSQENSKINSEFNSIHEMDNINNEKIEEMENENKSNVIEEIN